MKKYLMILILSIFSFVVLHGQTQEEISINQYNSGKTNKFSSRGEGKSQGLKINIKYPESWKSLEGEHTNVVRKFTQPEGYVMGLILINKLDAEITKSEIDEFMATEGLKSLLSPSAKYISSNSNLKIEGLRSSSIEFTDTNQRLDLTIYTHCLFYFIAYKQYLISIQFFVSGNSDETIAAVNERYERIKLLFPSMFNSIVIDNIWE